MILLTDRGARETSVLNEPDASSGDYFHRECFEVAAREHDDS